MKKIIFTIIILLFFFNSVNSSMGKHISYYAKHLSHREGTNPTIVLVGDNLLYVYVRNEDEFTFDTELLGHVQVTSQSNSSNMFIRVWSGSYILSYNDTTYRFNDLGQVVKYDDSSPEFEDYHVVELQEDAEKAFEEFFASVLSQDDEPLINLQWLVNLKYGNDFR